MAERPSPPAEASPDREQTLVFVRLNTHERLQHMIFFVCFLLLVITGFTLRLPEEWMRRLSATPFTYEVRSTIHRWAGLVIIAISLIHIYYVILFREGRAWLRDIAPRRRDFTEARQNFAFYLGLRREPPRFDRFNYKEKMEYWALAFGNVLMSLTGLIMMFEHLWGQLGLEVAALIHRMEAILACLALIVWHMYEVHFRPGKFPHSEVWWHGLSTEEEMREEPPAQLDRLMKTGKAGSSRLQVHGRR
jgi:formate dehydrogenase gamma subunit